MSPTGWLHASAVEEGRSLEDPSQPNTAHYPGVMLPYTLSWDMAQEDASFSFPQ